MLISKWYNVDWQILRTRFKLFHYHWWTASIKPRLLFSHSGLVSWGLPFLQFNLRLYRHCCNVIRKRHWVYLTTKQTHVKMQNIRMYRKFRQFIVPYVILKKLGGQTTFWLKTRKRSASKHIFHYAIMTSSFTKHQQNVAFPWCILKQNWLWNSEELSRLNVSICL